MLPHPVLAVTGLRAEARIAAGSGIASLAGGGDSARLAVLLQAALGRGARGVISFGIAGGLAPGLRPGHAIIGRSVQDGGHRIETDPDWLAALAAALPEAMVADLVGVDRAVCRTEDKRALHAASGAAAVDMESHVAARLALIHDVPFAALRIVADPHDRVVPAAAAVGLRPDGSPDIAAVLRALGRRPADLPALIHTALDARTAFRSLARHRRGLSAALGFDDGRPQGRFCGTPARDGDLAFGGLVPASPDGPAKST